MADGVRRSLGAGAVRGMAQGMVRGAAGLALGATLLCSVLPPATARAQEGGIDRTPAERATLVQLSYALGEAHALHRLCAGPADATWYARMERLEAEEGADEGFRRRLVDSFNAGFSSREMQFPECGRSSRAAERSVAVRGRALARTLARSGP